MSAEDQKQTPNGSPEPVRLTATRKGFKKGKGRRLEAKRSQVSSEDLPKKTLEDALRVASAIKNNFGNAGATWEQIADVLGISAAPGHNRYLLWSAAAYGLITKEDEIYKVSETARKILAPTFDGEDREGVLKAIATPSILARFYTDYSGSPLPQGDIFKNVVKEKYGVPSNRVEETINLLVDNARYGKLLETQQDGRLKLLSISEASGVGTTQQKPAADVSSTGQIPLVSHAPTEYSKACFVITPIGDENSPERKHADAMLRHLITPVLEQLGVAAIRADKIAKPGHMAQQMVEHIAYCKLCITDLSFGNQNAGYELGIRHAFKLPSIQIVRKGDKIPFDVQQGRTIIIDTSDPYTIMDRLESAKAELAEHVKALLDNKVKKEESPITMYLPGLTVKFG